MFQYYILEAEIINNCQEIVKHVKVYKSQLRSDATDEQWEAGIATINY